MAPPLLYTICAVGAAALYVVLRTSRRPVAGAAALLGLAAVAWLLVRASAISTDPADRPTIYFFLFSLIAVASAVRMITHRRPVYSALYFILVVVSSAGLFLLMHAEFMAFALIIVYAGAILITYMFVIMLAQQNATVDDRGLPEYDAVPREPAAAATVGFVILALLATMIYRPGNLPASPTAEEGSRAAWQELERLPEQFRATVLGLEPDFNWPPAARDDGHLISVGDDGAAHVLGTIGDSADVRAVDLPISAMPENVQRVGLALVQDFPVSLELAGVILLLAMFGAVILARRQIELGEDETREAAGLRRFAIHDDDGEGVPRTTEGDAP